MLFSRFLHLCFYFYFLYFCRIMVVVVVVVTMVDWVLGSESREKRDGG